MSDVLERIREAVIDRKREEIGNSVNAAIAEGLHHERILNEGLIAAMDIVGRRFAAGEIFVPEMLVSALTMKMGLEIVKPLLTQSDGSSKGLILIGTVKGDLHDIGKNIVAIMLEGAGFTVVDLGVDLPAQKIADKVQELKPNILGLSALLTTTMPELQGVLKELDDRELRNKVKVMIGGAPVDARFAEKIGADGYGEDAAEAVHLARRLLTE
jgi:5-methyltetrahydrofolate--homocysteine methyltransferase